MMSLSLKLIPFPMFEPKRSVSIGFEESRMGRAACGQATHDKCRERACGRCVDPGKPSDVPSLLHPLAASALGSADATDGQNLG